MFSFEGRINRTRFWLGSSIYFLVSTWSSAAAFLVVMSQRPGHPALWVVAPFVFIPFALFSLLAVGIKRLHDRAKSGSWMIGFLLPAWVLNLASEFVDRSAIAGEYWISVALSIAANAFLVWGLVEPGLMRGMTGVNRYGEAPLAPSHS